ncbi:MAG: VOC family protein [Ignavibacteriaceae bacterium]|nr:VOC family protein [Ignavibacteriaceae bacterium]
MSTNFIAHVELPTTNIEKSTDFFKRALGWELKHFGSGYSLFNTKKGVTIGLRKVNKVDQGETPVFHVLVEDIDRALENVEIAGGKIFKPRTVIPVYGWYAVIQDLEGNKIGLYQAS